MIRRLKNIKLSILALAFIALAVLSCKNEKNELSDKDFVQFKEPLRNVNKQLLEKDAARINAYCKRLKWEMEVTETGLFYNVFVKGKGDSARAGMYATIDYEVKLLDGRICYSTDSLGPETFKVGQGQVELGLEQGILMMQEGSKAHFIMPPHLAHGLIGDENKIPPRSIIVYNIELLKIFE